MEKGLGPAKGLSTTKLWVGVGAYVVVAGSALPAAGPAEAQTQPHAQPPGHGAHRAAPPQAAGPGGEGERGHARDGAHGDARSAAAPGQGGEGGEGGEGGAGALAGLSPDAAYAARLELIRGHVLVGRELLGAGARADALPHFLHPAEEVYGDLEPELRARRVAPFRRELDALAGAVRAGAGAEEVGKRQAAVSSALDRAAAALPAGTRSDPGFVAGVAAAVLRSAAEEYAEAVEGDRIANPVEYQDGRGFLRAAEGLLRSHERALRAKDAGAWEALAGAVAQLGRVWPAARPPDGPALPPGEVSALVSRVELAASRLR